MSIEIPFDPDQHRIDALTEGSGRSTFNATEQVKGIGDIPGSSEIPTLPTTRKRVRRPLGRAAAEVGGSDVSRMLANQEAIEQPITPEQRVANQRSAGHAEFLRVKAELAYKRSLEKAGDDPQALRVVLRKLAEDK